MEIFTLTLLNTNPNPNTGELADKYHVVTGCSADCPPLDNIRVTVIVWR